MTPADRIAELESVTELPEEPARIPGSMNLYVPRADYDKLREAAVAMKAENESLRAECGLRQIQGYNEGKKNAEAALADKVAEIGRMQVWLDEADTKIIRLNEQLATARQNERERCAKLCEDILLCDSDEKYDNEKAEQIGEGTSWNKAVRSYAKSIRALTNEG